jgi:hypothetical protein
MSKYVKYMGLLIAIVFYPLSCLTQELNIRQIGERLDTSLSKMSSQIKTGEIQKLMVRPTDFNVLDAAIDRSGKSKYIIFTAGISYSEPFLASLKFDAEAFENFVRSADMRRIALSTYYNVLDASWDLEFKARLVQASKTDRVKVKVNTVNEQGRKIHGCTVWYVPFLKDDDQHKAKFDRLSTPTTDLIPGGKWKIWTERQRKRGPKTPFYCGDDGRDEREIDILAPQ